MVATRDERQIVPFVVSVFQNMSEGKCIEPYEQALFC